MRKSLLFIAAIVISMSASAQKKTFKYFNEFKPKMFSALDVSKAKSFKLNGAKFKAPSLMEDADGNPSVYYMRPAGGFFMGLSTNKYFPLYSLNVPANTDVTFQAVFDPADGDLDFEWVYALSAAYNEETEKVDTVWSEPIEGEFIASEPDAQTGRYDYSNRGELTNGTLTISNEMDILYPAPMLTAFGGDPRNPTEATYFAGGEDGVNFGFGSNDIVDYGILSYFYSPTLQSYIDQWNADMHFVNYEPNLVKSFYTLENYFATNSEEANTNLTDLFGYDAMKVKGFAEYFSASETPYYLTGVRGTIALDGVDEIESDGIEINIYDANTFEPLAVAPITSLTQDSWGLYFLTAEIDPIKVEGDFFVLITPAEGSELQLSPGFPTTTSMENAYDDGTVYILTDITYQGTEYPNQIVDIFGLKLGDYNFIQSSMIGIMTTYEEPEPSGINTVSAAKKADNSIYSISGVKVSNGSQKGLATGVYVQNGKKIVIK